jgi:hypothetical protein
MRCALYQALTELAERLHGPRAQDAFTGNFTPMQREVEALLAAYLADRNKETRVVQDLLTILAVGSAERQRMLRDLAAAVGGIGSSSPAEPLSTFNENVPTSSFDDDLCAAISQLRDARAAMMN